MVKGTPRNSESNGGIDRLNREVEKSFAHGRRRVKIRIGLWELCLQNVTKMYKWQGVLEVNHHVNY